MDIVFIRDLRIETVIGIYDWEREITQTVVFDLEMGADIKKAAASDAIEDALDYKAVSKRLVSFVRESKFQLVETLAERCADIVLHEFNVPWVRLTLNKIGAVSMARDVGVIIERSRSD
ncbi:MAG: dihydroneopterin aldolase [gamma proteobacterium symbiont of Stewartia floridana]|uniref:7,8-dihydroneopterin aldolase n=1 Tax=Candidatus Thiodiazotropha taylori TaxID=2792791 RepID=A0A9E4N437_9GAMM|nr:dihydroneopterin aldolase [Candidatus Thiodiazotropha taylori]RLW51622.1 MAG: dihydroneopterin aldolase [gamma proteobacterium symbiont of Stewartia floridana]MCG7926172.1 dihydroneopterin aldolase [Candidatus Thiodiazotropha taylori]MCG7933894.1 dihydroneopterin aldolase [Candidatus Thiodiazotropha taylori]MCG7946432.1 dihydroneopterin aldolase [Candidatus Thiodiazotropha taylori]